jgi:hypothetical protein
MTIPFTVEQFFDIFGTYNTTIWPAQVVVYIFGLIALGLDLRENKLSSRIISGILAPPVSLLTIFLHTYSIFSQQKSQRLDKNLSLFDP